MIADLLNWKCPGSQERRLLSGKTVVSIVYGEGKGNRGRIRERCGISIINKRKLKG